MVRNHIRHITSVCVVFYVYMYSFAGLIWRTPLPTFNDTSITDRHPDNIFQLKVPGLERITGDTFKDNHIIVCWIGNIVRTRVSGASLTQDLLRKRRADCSQGQALRLCRFNSYNDVHVFCKTLNICGIKFLRFSGNGILAYLNLDSHDMPWLQIVKKIGCKICNIIGLGLASPRPKAIVVIPKINSCQTHLRKKTIKSAKYPWPLRYKKDPLKNKCICVWTIQLSQSLQQILIDVRY